MIDYSCFRTLVQSTLAPIKMTGLLLFLLASSWSKERFVFNFSAVNSDIGNYVRFVEETIMSFGSKEKYIPELAETFYKKELTHHYAMRALKSEKHWELDKRKKDFSWIEKSYKYQVSHLSQRFRISIIPC